MKLTSDVLQQMVRMAVRTRPDEIDCQECFEELDRFAELHLAGKSPEEALPLVQDHLKRCSDCRDEFEALLDALRATSAAA
jgi:predicted anti-sigma-YlaC factor YlaD